MAVSNIWNSVHVILVLAVSIWGKPTCRTRLRTDVSCVAGENDYILDRGLVSDNNNTIAIILKNCRIIEVEHGAFKNNYYLESLDLSRNKITYLKLGILDDIRNLKALRVSQNLLTTLPLGIFDQVYKLERLDISDNKIRTLELGIFKSLPRLLRLGLNGNALLGKDLSPLLFNQNPKITFMDFSQNNMSESPDNLLHALTTLAVLGLNNCSLTDVPKFATSGNLKTLTRLLLQTNKIKSLDDPTKLSNLENLETLDLIGNEIDHLNESVFKPLRKLNFIDLSFNIIETIPENLFRGMTSVQHVDLTWNKIKIVPVNAFRGTRLKTLNLGSNRISFLESNFCLELINSDTRLKTLNFKDNPFQCLCLLEILNEVKKFGITYNSDQYNGKQAVCSMTNAFICMRQKSEFEYPLDLRSGEAHHVPMSSSSSSSASLPLMWGGFP